MQANQNDLITLVNRIHKIDPPGFNSFAFLRCALANERDGSNTAWEELRAALVQKDSVWTVIPPYWWDKQFDRVFTFIQARFGKSNHHAIVHETEDELAKNLSVAGAPPRRSKQQLPRDTAE